MFPRNFFKINF